MAARDPHLPRAVALGTLPLVRGRAYRDGAKNPSQSLRMTLRAATVLRIFTFDAARGLACSLRAEAALR